MLLCAALLPSAAQELYENKKIDYRFDNLLAEAEKGNIVAIYALGETYRYGSRYSATYKGEPDYQKAYEYFKKAADYGYPWASWDLARMYSVNQLDDPDGTEEKRWFEKAFNDFKFYADNGDGDAMVRLAEYYGGTNGDEYEDYVKDFYWSLRALEEGEPDGASSIATCFTYGYAVNENPAFSRAWDARWCIEAAGKGWPVNEYPEFDSLSAAGYTKNDWKFLAASTYVSVPRYATQNEDSIVDAALLAVDLLNQKAGDFAVEMKVYKQDKALAAAATQKTQGSFSTNLIPQAPQQAVAAQPKKKTNWLSAIGRALNVASSAGGGNNFISGLVQGLSSGSVATGAGAAGGVNAAALDVFKYTGTQRQGQTDANGRVIKSEYNALPGHYGNHLRMLLRQEGLPRVPGQGRRLQFLHRNLLPVQGLHGHKGMQVLQRHGRADHVETLGARRGRSLPRRHARGGKRGKLIVVFVLVFGFFVGQRGVPKMWWQRLPARGLRIRRRLALCAVPQQRRHAMPHLR